MDQEGILVTGGSGLLGRHLRELLPGACYPTSREFDVTDPAGMERYVAGRTLHTLLHAAAATSPPRIEREPARALEINVVGTANVVRLAMAHGWRLVYISTDYVFRGDRGLYREDDAVYPVNKYAWSKLAGECAVRLYDNALIVRTTFGPVPFPYEKAFSNQWTSRQSVGQIAAKVVRLLEGDLRGTIHVGGPRRTVHDYARSLNPGRPLESLSIHDVNFPVPVDTSLDCSQYNRLVGP